MASTHTARTLITSQALAVSSSVNATEWNLSTAYGGIANVRITNGGSAPTVAPVVTFYTGDATGKKYKLFTATGDTIASSVNDIPCEFPIGTMFANITASLGAATNGVTVEAYGQELTTI